MELFGAKNLQQLVIPSGNSSKGQNGQVTVIGGSKLFHGAPLLALTTASRLTDMVFFASPEPSVGEIAEKVKSDLLSFIWIPWEEREDYIAKSDAILIGSGMMRYKKESNDGGGEETREITRDLLLRFPDKKWVIDAGSLQMIEKEWIPRGAILTPNQKEYQRLFGDLDPSEASKKFNCVIVQKLPVTTVCSPDRCTEVRGGNAGLTKGGTGDVQAGITAGLLAKNDPFLAAAAASFIVKKAADDLYKKVGIAYNADDLAREIPKMFSGI
jgi:NAD(P)H-hydrate epimerase